MVEVISMALAAGLPAGAVAVFWRPLAKVISRRAV